VRRISASSARPRSGSVGTGKARLATIRALDDHGELRVARIEPQHDAPASGMTGHQTGEAVDPDADEPRREAGIPRIWRMRSWLRRSTRHEQHAQGSPRLARQDLEVEQRLAGREGEDGAPARTRPSGEHPRRGPGGSSTAFATTARRGRATRAWRPRTPASWQLGGGSLPPVSLVGRAR
jgi:hypothetical protein